MRKNKLFLLSGMACLVGAGLLATNTNAKAPVIEETKRVAGGEVLLLEAENAYVTGTPHVEGHDFVEVGKTSDNPAHPTSGGDSVGYWATAGNKVTWTVLADNALTGVGMEWWMSNGDTTTKTLSESLKVTINGTVVPWTTATMSGRDGNKWANWTAVTGGQGSFKKGRNIIVLENLDGMNAAIDCLNLSIPAGAQGNYIEVPTDKVAPTLANLGVEGTPKVGDQVTVKYDLTDDVNTKEECVVELTVTYEKGTKHAEKVEIANGKFTAAKGGKYTITAIAKDETGNTSAEAKADVQIGEYVDPDAPASTPAESTPEKPNNGGQAAPQRQWEDADTGYVIFGITMGLTAALVVTMVLLRKLKPEAFKVEEKENGGNE